MAVLLDDQEPCPKMEPGHTHCSGGRVTERLHKQTQTERASVLQEWSTEKGPASGQRLAPRRQVADRPCLKPPDLSAVDAAIKGGLVPEIAHLPDARALSLPATAHHSRLRQCAGSRHADKATGFAEIAGRDFCYASE